MYSSSMYSIQQEVDPSNAKINRALASLTVVEVFYLLQHLCIEVPFDVLQRHQVNGEILSFLTNPWELNELHIQIPTLKAKLLLTRIETFKVEGVPSYLISPKAPPPVVPGVVTSPTSSQTQIVYPRSNPEYFQFSKMYADQGHLEGQFNVGVCYDLGRGVAVDKERAFGYFKLAADRGHPQALCNVGYCYYHGSGVAKNRPEAFRYYKMSADQGYEGGMFNVAMCYSKGKGVAMNKEDAFLYFELAAALGNYNALTNLGYCYDKGEGTVVDKAEALRCYREAADKGQNPTAQYCMGVFLSTGEAGVNVDRQLAFQYWKVAADQGNLAIAQRSVADCYARGDGVSRDKKEAKKYYRKAAATATGQGGAVQVDGCGVGCPIS